MTKMPMPFSNPTTYAGHGGIDFGKPSGTPIPAIADGTITYAATWGTGGLTKTITRSDGLKIMYCHLANLNGPKVGAKVKKGQIVGYVGNTGRSTGPHLHVEMWLNGVAQDEWKWMDRNNWIGKSSPANGGITPITDKEKNMTTLYYVAPHNNTRAKGKAGWALAGDAGDPTSPANWIETTDPDFGRALEAKHGPRVEVGPGGWNSFARDYRAGGTSVGNVTVSADFDYEAMGKSFAKALLDEQSKRLAE